MRNGRNRCIWRLLCACGLYAFLCFVWGGIGLPTLSIFFSHMGGTPTAWELLYMLGVSGGGAVAMSAGGLVIAAFFVLIERERSWAIVAFCAVWGSVCGVGAFVTLAYALGDLQKVWGSGLVVMSAATIAAFALRRIVIRSRS